jgi:hypothetical protein
MSQNISPAQALVLAQRYIADRGDLVSKRFSTEHEDAYIIQNYDPSTSPADPGSEDMYFPLIVLKDGTVKDSKHEMALSYRYGLRSPAPANLVTVHSVAAGKEIAIAKILNTVCKISSSDALKIVRQLASLGGYPIRTRDRKHADEVLEAIRSAGGNATYALTEMPVEMPAIGNPFLEIDDSAEVELPPTYSNGWQVKLP